jgi:hypothetical protein
VSAYFDKKPYKKGVFINSFRLRKTRSNQSKMIPWLLDDYMKKRAANAFNHDINSPAFRTDPEFQ